MPIPHSRKFGIHILEHLKDSEPHNLAEVTDKLAERLELTEEQLKERTEKSKSLKFDIHVRVVLSHLRHALLLENLSPGVFKITARGLDVLKENPVVIDFNYLKKFPEYKKWREDTKSIQKISKKTERREIQEKFGLVAFMDVLGTKDLWKRSDAGSIPKIWNNFTTQFQEILKFAVKDEEDAKLSFNTFSDTIIITLEFDNVDYLLSRFGTAIWTPIVRSIELGIPLRGCFSIGTFYHKGTFFIGEAITEAAQYYELPQWIGVSASPSANFLLEQSDKKTSSIFNYYKKCIIPLKNSIEQEAWAVNWPELYAEKISENENNSNSEDISKLIDAQLENAKNIDVALKWRNTRKFFDESLSLS